MLAAIGWSSRRENSGLNNDDGLVLGLESGGSRGGTGGMSRMSRIGLLKNVSEEALGWCMDSVDELDVGLCNKVK
jgi:hypothetical protein